MRKHSGAWVAGLILCALAARGADPGRALPKHSTQAGSIADAPLNTWVKISEMKTGGREQPLFVYAANIGKFVMATGLQTLSGGPRHYDTEEFDLAAARWINAYPPSVAAGRPQSGPVGEAYARERAAQGYNGPVLFYKDGDRLRPGAGGQWLSTKAGYEWCCVPPSGKVYLYLWDKTLCYDPVARAWQDLAAEPREKCRIWGSLCYDPLNKEILHAGGDGGSADVGTWAYSIEKNEWRQLEFAAPLLQGLFLKAKDLRWQAKDLLGRSANRFAVTETAEEAKADLAKQAVDLTVAAEKLAGQIKSAALRRNEKVAGGVALGRLASAVAGLKAVGPSLSGKIMPALIGEVRAVRVLLEQVVDALAVEPPGRARSQIAYDPAHEKIVLFGGDGLDRVLSDTWLYDCRTRTWEQEFPERCPAPRAGHILAWLPKAGRIVLAGGYSRTWLAQEIWTYDVAANQWKLLVHVPLADEDWGRQKYSQNCPRVTSRQNQLGAVNEDDVLVCGTPALTWACKVDPGKVDEQGTLAMAATSGSYTFNTIDPATWEKVANPDPEKTGQFYKDMPLNQWTALGFPKYAPGAQNRWGTTAYDTDRHQFLFWGGGHATSHENDVAHFSVLGSVWTIAYHPDDPIENVYAEQPTPVSFNDRRHVPIHAYRAYCYDPACGRMLYFEHAYNPTVREWDPAPLAGLQHLGPMHSQMASTPAGAVTYSAKGLFQLDAQAGRWVKLPWKGPSPGGIWCDGHALKYDCKRNCLWLATEKDIFRYELAGNTARKLTVAKPKALGQFLFWSEAAYLPDADLMLLMRLFAKPDGRPCNVAWDPNDSKFYWVDLAFAENGKPLAMKENRFGWSDALAYDPGLKLALLNNSSASKVWALRFDRKTAKMEEIAGP